MTEKKRFYLEATVSTSAHTVVYANNADEAREIAYGRSVQLCGQGWTADECWIIEDADGTPHNVEIYEP